MATRVRLRKQISVEDLALPPPLFVRDTQGRITQMHFDHFSIREQVETEWIGATSDVRTSTPGTFDQEDWMIAKRLVTSAELKALLAMPIEIVPAPGSGNALFPVAILVDYKFGTAAYTVANCDVQVLVGASAWAYGGSGVLIGILDETAAALAQGEFAHDQQARTAIENLPLKIANLGSADLLAGDGTLAVTVLYRIVNLAP
jgi:hypothetical protein